VSESVGQGLATLLRHQFAHSKESALKISKNLLTALATRYKREKGQLARTKAEVRIYAYKFGAFRRLVMDLGFEWL
jgi:hypothetical protein